MGGLPVGCIEEGFTVGYEVLGLIFMEVWWSLLNFYSEILGIFVLFVLIKCSQDLAF